MASGASLIIGFIIVVLASLVAWVFSPKGDNQTVWRSTLILSFASCYIMWGMFGLPLVSGLVAYGIIAIVFLAQWHPLIAPKRSDIRPDRIPE